MAAKELGHPARFYGPAPLGLPDLGRLVEKVAHHLPADNRIAGQEPVHNRVVGHAASLLNGFSHSLEAWTLRRA